jgi:VPDSG-CTERM motif
MTYRLRIIIIALGGIGVMLAGQANAVTFTFQENGSNVNLGATSIFSQGGLSLTASGFLTAGGSTALYAKNLGFAETGLGLARDPSGDNEITTDDFVQLTLPTTPPSTLNMVVAASVQPGESALVYFTTISGSLTGATLIGTITTEGGSITIPAGDQIGFLDITAGSHNVLLKSVTFTPTTVPDTGSTLALLGMALVGAEGLRRMVRAGHGV